MGARCRFLYLSSIGVSSGGTISNGIKIQQNSFRIELAKEGQLVMNEIVKFGATAKWLHWLIAFFAILFLIFGQTFESIPISEREEILMGHSGIGTFILLLMLIRLAWRSSHGVPAPTAAMGI